MSHQGTGISEQVLGALRDVCAEQGAWPLLAVQTQYSLLYGTANPSAFAAVFARLYGDVAPQAAAPAKKTVAMSTVGAGSPTLGLLPSAQAAVPVPELVPPSGPWALLADDGDLMALPEVVRTWGRAHVAVGVTLVLQAHLAEPAVVVFMVPTETAYKHLCRILSWRHEDPDGWRLWQLSGDCTRDFSEIIALCDDDTWCERLAACGAEVFRRWHDQRPDTVWPLVFAPLITDLTAHDQRRARALCALHDKKTKKPALSIHDANVARISLEQLPDICRQVPQDILCRGAELLARCTYCPGAPGANGLPVLHMPQLRVADPNRLLAERAQNGVYKRYGDHPSAAVQQRLHYELGVIQRKGFASYILAVEQIAQGRRTCGRGSGASSLVCYALGITNVDPVRYHLVFERFLSDERLDPPDIDIDFPYDERDSVLQRVISEYGREHVAMIATHQRLSHRGALREAARLAGKGRVETSQRAQAYRVAERYGGGYLAEGQAEGQAENQADSEWSDIVAHSALLTGQTRHCGLHCGGVVITDDPVRDLVPVHAAAKIINGDHVPAIAWEKDGAEAMGLVKMDLLGNRSLAVVRDVLDDLAADGISIDESRWRPQDDPLVKRLIERGRTMGCFYIESPAMRLLNAKAGQIDFDRLVVHSSIIRPAANTWINVYLERLAYFTAHGEHKSEWYPHPVLQGLLSDSFGVLSYQEDVMLVAKELAGFRIHEQNILRKALGKSDTPQRLAALETQFFAGCREKGVDESVYALVWNMITSFAGYSFCKAHSASYAMVSYQCACLKIHNPAYFMARVIAHEGGFYDRSAYVEEARRFHVQIEAPCVVRSEWLTRGEGAGTIRLGFHCVGGLGQQLADRICDARKQDSFSGIGDFIARVPVHRRQLQILYDAGAFDGLLREVPLAQRQWLVRAWMHRLHNSEQRTPVETLSFLDRTVDLDEELVPPSGLKSIDQRTRDRRMFQVLGCLPRAHPFALWDIPQRQWQCRHVHPRAAQHRITLWAWCITRKQVRAVQKNKRNGTEFTAPHKQAMAFVDA